MIVTRHTRLEMELIHWVLLVIAAIALMLAIATTLAAANPIREPRLLPAGSIAMAKPMPRELVRPFFPESPPVRILPPAEAADRLWMALESQRAGCFGDAISGWEQIDLPDETAHWREIGMAAAFLQAGDLQKAELHLNVARRLAPANAVGAYFTGVLRLEQAAASGRIPGDTRRHTDMLVSYTPAEDQREWRMLAILELQNAIAWSGNVRFDQRLLTIDSQIEETVVVPRVSDLLASLRADNFVGKAHHLLFGLYFDGGNLSVAEFHLDQAAATGIAVLYGYRDLAATYLDEGLTSDALRVAGKDLDVNQPWIRPLCKRLAELSREGTVSGWVW
jgi:hypothetical protein